MHGFLWGTNYFSSSNFHISLSAGNCDRTTLLQVQHYPLQVQHYPNLCLNDLPLTTMLILKFEVFDWKSSGVAQWVAHLARYNIKTLETCSKRQFTLLVLTPHKCLYMTSKRWRRVQTDNLLS